MSDKREISVVLTEEEAKLLLGARDPEPIEHPNCAARERARGKLRSALNEGEGQGEPMVPMSDDDRSRLREIARLIEHEHARDDAQRDARFLHRFAERESAAEGEGEQVGEAEPRERIEEVIGVCRRAEERLAPDCEEGLPNGIARAQGESQAFQHVRELLEQELPPELRDSRLTHQQIQELLGSEEAVERVAKAIFEGCVPRSNCGWSGLITAQREYWRGIAQEALRLATQLFGEGAGDPGNPDDIDRSAKGAGQ